METLLAKKVEELGMSIDEFASKAGITLDQANRVLNGTYCPYHATQMQILRALGLDILVGTNGDPKHKEALVILNDMRLHRNKSVGRRITYKTYFNTLKEEKCYTVYDVQRMLEGELGKSVSINNIYNYLSGRELPPVEVMYAFCDIFEVATADGIDHFIHDHENFVQDLKTLEDGKKSGYAARKKNEEIQTLCEKYSSSTKDSEIENLIEANDNLLKDIDREKNDIFIEVLRDRLIKMVDEAVFDEADIDERCDRLKDMYYQINCTLYILHKFKTKGNTPKIKENTLYEE